MPNLFSASPVEIYGWVTGSTLGLTLIAIGAVLFNCAAILFIRFISSIDSDLINLILFSKANIISSSVFPTPEKIILDGSTPAFLALKNSPAELTSIPAPRLSKVLWYLY